MKIRYAKIATILVWLIFLTLSITALKWFFGNINLDNQTVESSFYISATIILIALIVKPILYAKAYEVNLSNDKIRASYIIYRTYKNRGILKRIIVKMFGGIEPELLEAAEKKIQILDTTNTELNEFVSSISTYVGSYPYWKVQQEYRSFLSNNGLQLSGDYPERPEYHENVDLYLSRLMLGLRKLSLSEKHPFVPCYKALDDDQFDSARGAQYLSSNQT